MTPCRTFLKRSCASRLTNTMFLVICTIACLAFSTRAQLKYNQSRRDSWDNVRNYSSRGDLSDIDLVNLMRVLDLVSNSGEFQPLKISIATLGANPDLSGRISKFLKDKLIISYQVELGYDLHSAPLAHQVGLTWIILVKNRHNFESYLSWSRALWSPKDKYIVFILGRHHSDQTHWKKIFSTLWNRNQVSKILIGSIDDHFQYVYKYLPFKIDSGEYGSVQKILIDQENIEIFLKNYKKRITNFESSRKLESLGRDEILPLKEIKTLFEDFKDMNNYTINVTTFISQMMNISNNGNTTEFSGLDAKTMFLLRDILNANFQIEILPTGAKIDPFEKGLCRIESGKTDLILTTFFVKPYGGHKSFDFTVGVYFDKVCLIGRSAGRVPKSFMPFLPFSLNFWPVLIFYNIFISAFWVWFKNLSDKIHRELPISRFKNTKSQKNLEISPPEINSGVITCVDITVMTCSHLKGAETTPQRFFVAGTLCFAVVLLGVYECTLISSLSKPFRYRELSTLEDVAESNLPILTKYRNLKTNTFYDSVLKEKIVVVNNKELNTRQIVARNKSVLGIMRLSSTELKDNSEFYDEDGENTLHMVEECPDEYTLSYVVRRFSPYSERINTLLLRMSQAGLFRKWYEEMQFPILKAEKRKCAENGNVKAELTLVHYSLTFYGLLGSLLCCTLVFIAEIQFARTARFRKNKGN